jgi:hypothetical protein
VIGDPGEVIANLAVIVHMTQLLAVMRPKGKILQIGVLRLWLK